MKNNKENCPHCNADLQGDPIPKNQQGSYNATHFTRKIGISDIERDRIVKWKCPDCEEEWDIKKVICSNDTGNTQSLKGRLCLA